MHEPHQPPVGPGAPSPWVLRFARLVPPGPVLDLAAGTGRHARHLLAQGRAVTAVDRDVAGLADLAGRVEIVAADLEGAPWPLGVRRFAGIVVANYLHRPIFPAIVAALAPGGVLIYETFALGQQRFGRPTNPEFLLRPGELLEATRGLCVLAYEDLVVEEPGPKRVQRIAARAPMPAAPEDC